MANRIRIHGSEQPIQKILSDDYAFEIPNYQRPYSWDTEQAGQLLDDLILAAFASDEKPYFLGSTVLVKKESDPTAEVIDGQQRLTTITILLSVLRELLPTREGTLNKLIYEKGDDILGTKDRFRVSLRTRDREFFEKHIQRGDLSGFPTSSVLTDSQANIRDNARLYLQRLQKELGATEKYTKLAGYVAQSCYLVVVETSDQDSAFRIFSVLNNRGRPLSLSDILKAEVLGAIRDTHLQDAYAKKWEDLEEGLGREDFEQLFSHIRTILKKTKARQSILAEIREAATPTLQPAKFIDETLIPYANAYNVVRNSELRATKNEDQINHLFGWLNQIDNDDWIPAAMTGVKRWAATDVDRLLVFVRRLERLAFALFALRSNINERIDRYAKVVSAAQGGVDPRTLESGLGLKPSEKKQLIEVLSGNVYLQKCARYVLLRLDEHLSEGEAHYNYPVISIEHVLPQTPAGTGNWIKVFSENDRSELTNCIGNLVLLSRRKNSESQNFDYDAKKTKYFGSSATSFSLTKRAVEAVTWTPALVRKRRDDLVQLCGKIWLLAD